jgi:hypothetical protein
MMPTVKKIKRVQERRFTAHHMLLHAARRALDDAERGEPGSFYGELAALTFSALAIEALCNAIGDAVIDGWDDFQNLSPTSKLRFLAEHLKVPYDKASEPWASAAWLVRFRNSIAHARPELLREELLMTQEEHDDRLFDRPLSKLEQQINVDNARRSLRAVEQIKNALLANIDPHDVLGLTVDGTTGSSSLHDPQNQPKKKQGKISLD